MKERRKFTGRTSHERWLVSYADFITLLFAFFVVMFSSARMDKERTSQLAEAKRWKIAIACSGLLASSTR